MSWRCRVAAVVCFFLATASALATTYVVPPDAEMVGRCDAIIVGVAGQSFTQIAAYGGIETVTPFTVSDVIKGHPVASSITVHEPGGEFNGRIALFDGAPRFAAGEKDILFLSRTPQRTWAVTDLALGRFAFEMDRAGRQLAIRAENDIVGWDSHLEAYREHRRDAQQFLDFLRAVTRGEKPAIDYAVPYLPIRLPMSSEALQPTSNAVFSATSYSMFVGDGSGARWFTFPSAVTYKYNLGAGANATNALNAMNAALGLWNNDVGSNVNLVNGGNDAGAHMNGAAGPGDGGNTVNFERSLAYVGVGPFTCPGDGSYSGVLGVGGPTVASTPKQTGPDGAQWYVITEGDVDMNINTSTCAALVTNQTFTGAVTHEVGHSIGFRHADKTRNDSGPCDSSIDCIASSVNAPPSAIMESFIDAGLHTLQTWDVAAADAIYPGGTPPPAAPVHNDFNGDRKSDIFWRNAVSGANAAYLMTDRTFTGGLVNFEVDPNYKIVGTGDFDGDGKTDILWRNMSTGANVIYVMNSVGGINSINLLNFEVDFNYKIIGTGDFNGDGKTDIWWRHSVSGANVVYLMNASAGIASINLVNFEPDVNWKIQGFGDFNGDGKFDVLWRNSVSGANVIYTMNGSSVTSSTLVNFEPDMNWKIVEIGDFNGDGKADILWRNSSTGANVTYDMNGTSIASAGLVNFEPDQNWKIIP